MIDADLLSSGLVTIRDMIAKGDVSSQEVTRAVLDQAESFRQEFSLFISFTRDLAMEQSQRADRARAEGKPLGPLHGVPITVKDNIDVAGIPCTAGSKVFRERIPTQDATVVAKLREAGAVFLGKTNMHEMAMGGTSVNPHYGAVRNPWAPDRISGGSSGGAAACVSLGIGYGALGTDCAGSVRIPACLCGLVGLKPTHGVVSLSGCIPTLTWTADHIGPITRSVSDAALMFSLMRGYDKSDPDSSPRPLEPFPPAEDLGGLTIGVPQNYFFEYLDREIADIFNDTLDLMGKNGAKTRRLTFEMVEHMHSARLATMAESFLFHEPYLKDRPEDYSPAIRYRLLSAQYILATDYVRAARVRRLIMEEMAEALRSVDIMIMPTTVIPAFPIGADSIEINGKDISLTGPQGSMILLRNTQPMNWSGVPALTLPMGVTSRGLPVGLQVTAAPFQDLKLLGISSVLEKLIGFDPTPPILKRRREGN